MELAHEALKFMPHDMVLVFTAQPTIEFDPYQGFIAPLQPLAKTSLSLASHIEAVAFTGDEAVMFGNPALSLLPFTYKVDNYDNFLYNRKYERGIYKGCNGKIWGRTSTGARKEVIK